MKPRKVLALLFLSILGLGVPILGLSVLAHADGALRVGAELFQEGDSSLAASTPTVHRASELRGLPLLDSQGTQVGAVRDLVVGPRHGTLEFTLVWPTGRSEGEGLTPVPLKLLETSEGADEPHFRFAGTAQQLSAAPRIDPEDTRTFRQGDWRAKVHAHFGTHGGSLLVEERPEALQDEPGPDPSRVEQVPAAELEVGVRGRTGEALGTVEELVVDLVQGRMAYIVVRTSGKLGLRPRRHAVPWILARLVQHTTGAPAHGFMISVAVGASALQEAPRYDADEWDRMSDPEWLHDLHAHYQVPPYWTDPSRAVPREASAPRGMLDDARKEEGR